RLRLDAHHEAEIQAVGLQPRVDPGRAEAAGQQAVLQGCHVRVRGAPARRAGGRAHAGTSAALSAVGPIPSVSGRPNMRFSDCTACEEVPFQRLSIAANTWTLPVRASAWTLMRQ